MSKKNKIWLVIATFLVLIGGLIFVAIMTNYNWDFTKLSTVKYETNSYEISKNIKDISVNTNTANIIFVPSENEKVKVVCYEQIKVKHTVSVNDCTLQIDVVDTRKWYDYIVLFFGSPKITIYIPQGDYNALKINSSTGDIKIPKDYNFESIDIKQITGDVEIYSSQSGKVKVKTSTGDVFAEHITANELDVAVSTGNISLSNITCDGDVKLKVSTGDTTIGNVKCNNIVTTGSTGDISLNNIISTEIISIERSTGDVELKNCDAAELYIETDTGDVEGTLLTDKIFIAKTDTGSIDVPTTTNGGKCQVTTDTGNIKFSYVNK